MASISPSDMSQLQESISRLYTEFAYIEVQDDIFTMIIFRNGHVIDTCRGNLPLDTPVN